MKSTKRLKELESKSASSSSSSTLHDPKELSEIEDLMVAIETRLLLELFFELDVRHQGKVPLISALKFMLQNGAITSEKELKRTLIKYRLQSQKQPGEVYLEQMEKQSAAARRRSSVSTENTLSRKNSSAHNLKRLASGMSVVTNNQDQNDEQQLNEEEVEAEEEDPEDPQTTFPYFVAVVRDPLKCVFKVRTAAKLLSAEETSQQEGFVPLFNYHNQFVARVENLRHVWKDKQ
jgi:hypothetical protein